MHSWAAARTRADVEAGLLVAAAVVPTEQSQSVADRSSWWPGQSGDLAGRDVMFSVVAELEERQRQQVRQGAADPKLIGVRRDTALALASELRRAGELLHLASDLAKGDQISGESNGGNSHDEQIAVGVLAQIGAELVGASAALLSGGSHYAGAALLRQVVEVEYLAWAFAEEKREAQSWLNSTKDERFNLFAPAKLRKVSDGRFGTADYQGHCEQGGHPGPAGVPLIGGRQTGVAQMLLVDLLLHGWRTADSLHKWNEQRAAHPQVGERIAAGRAACSRWGQVDPLYSLAVETFPAP